MLASHDVDLLNAISHYVWPLIVVVIVLVLLPQIRRILVSRNVTVKVGGTEISIQDVTKELARQVEDVRAHVASMQAGTAAASVPKPSPPPASLTAPGAAGGPPAAAAPAPPGAGRFRVLWVDDHPENNALLVSSLLESGIEVTQVRSTDDAVSSVETAGATYDAVVTDLSRREGLLVRSDAGIELLHKLRATPAPTPPVLVYAGTDGVRRLGEVARQAGALVATASPTELVTTLHQLGAPVTA